MIPSSALETVELALGIADGRTEADLKKFKSRLETTSPEVYEDGAGPEHADHNDKEE